MSFGPLSVGKFVVKWVDTTTFWLSSFFLFFHTTLVWPSHNGNNAKFFFHKKIKKCRSSKNCQEKNYTYSSRCCQLFISSCVKSALFRNVEYIRLV